MKCQQKDILLRRQAGRMYRFTTKGTVYNEKKDFSVTAFLRNDAISLHSKMVQKGNLHHRK